MKCFYAFFPNFVEISRILSAFSDNYGEKAHRKSTPIATAALYGFSASKKQGATPAKADLAPCCPVDYNTVKDVSEGFV